MSKPIRKKVRKKVDGRTRQAKQMKEILDGLSSSPMGTGKELLKRMIAQNTVIADEIYNYALNNEDLLNEKGELSPLLKSQFLRFQSMAKSGLTDLLKITGKKQEEEAGDPFNDVFDE